MLITINKEDYMSKITTYLSVIIIIVTWSTKVTATNTDTIIPTKGITINYRQNLWVTNIGVQLGIEKYYFQNSKYKVIGLASLVFERKPGVYNSAGFIFGNTLRRTYKYGIYLEHGLNIEYLGSYYNFDVYKTDSKGNIVNIGREWTNSGIFGYSVGLGYDFSRVIKTNMQLFLKPNFFIIKYPNNDNYSLLNNYYIEAGIVVHPKWIKWLSK
jgi:hypothetical protein